MQEVVGSSPIISKKTEERRLFYCVLNLLKICKELTIGVRAEPMRPIGGGDATGSVRRRPEAGAGSAWTKGRFKSDHLRKYVKFLPSYLENGMSYFMLIFMSLSEISSWKVLYVHQKLQTLKRLYWAPFKTAVLKGNFALFYLGERVNKINVFDIMVILVYSYR